MFVGAAVPAIISWYSLPGHDWRGAIRYVVRHAQPGDRVIAIRSQPWIYYSPRLSEEGLVPERIDTRQLSQKHIQKYDRIWFLLKKQGSSFARRLLDASHMTRRLFYDGPPEGWLYRRPIRVRRETGAGRRRAPGTRGPFPIVLAVDVYGRFELPRCA
jgi:hypothetical protein